MHLANYFLEYFAPCLKYAARAECGYIINKDLKLCFVFLHYDTISAKILLAWQMS